MNKSCILLLCGLLSSTQGHADLLGVSDAALLAKTIEQLHALKAQYDVLSQTYDTAKSQLDRLEQLKTLNTGHYGFGDLANSAADLKNRQWAPNTWSEALNNLAGGNPSRYQALVEAYQKSQVNLSDNDYSKGATPAKLKDYQAAKAFNQTLSVQATYAFNEVNTHLKAIHSLASQIEKTPNTKAAMDLNSRLIAEMAYIQTETLRLQTLLAQQAGFNGASTLRADSDIAQFNRLPDE